MLQQFVPRVSAEARRHLLRGTPHFMGALPRRPAFFSTTARRCSNDIPQAERSGTAATAAAATTIAKSTSGAASAESEPIPTNLDNPPEAVACTVSPPTTYAFLKPTPVVLLTGPFGGNWCFRDTWQTSLADQGYQSTSIELAMPSHKLDSGDAYIRHFVKVLKTSIETDHSFYPPILIAHGLHALVAQKYVESNPVSALVLVSPFIPEIIKGRFQELSHKLQIKGSSPASPPSSSSATAAERTSVAGARAATEQSASTTAQGTSTEQQREYKFQTHADVMAQEGFRETYVLPKKAVYKIDLVAKEIQEKEKAKEKVQKEQKEKKEMKDEKEDNEQKEEEERKGQQDLLTSKRQEQHHSSAAGSSGDATEESTVTKTTLETLGKDSVPVGESAADAQVTPGSVVDQDTSDRQTMELKEQEDASLPEQTVESEASIQSPLEQLPLTIYDSIPKSQFEPTFPILLVTSNADEIVSTADVKEHHFLAQEVDHIELEDRDDGGHLIMVSDNTEWEQGIQGITAWLDSNGM